MGVETAIAISLISAVAQPVLGALFGGGEQEAGGGGSGPRMDDLRAAKVTEGDPMWFFCGKGARVNATLIYQSKIKESKESLSVGSGKESSKVTVYEYSVDLVLGVGAAFKGVDGSGKISRFKKIKANGKKVYFDAKPNKDADRYDEIYFREGGAAQNTIPFYESSENHVPALRNTAAVGIEDLELEDFGAMPGSWEVIVAPNDMPFLVGDAIKEVWPPDRDADAELDVVDATGENAIIEDPDEGDERIFEGLQHQGPFNPLELLDVISIATDLVARDDGGVIKFMDRGKEDLVMVEARHVGAFPSDSSVPVDEAPVKITRDDEIRLPSMVVARYLDPKKAYQKGTQTYPVDGSEPGANLVSIDFPMAMRKQQAKRFCRRRAYEPYRLRNKLRANLPPSHFHIQETDIVGIPFEGQVHLTRTIRRGLGNDYRVVLEGPIEEQIDGEDVVISEWSGSVSLGDDDVEDDDPDDDNEDDDDDEEYEPPLLDVAILDTPGFTDEHVEKTGFIYAAAAFDPGLPFKYTTLYKSNKSDGTYEKVGSSKFKNEAPVGVVVAANDIENIEGGGASFDVVDGYPLHAAGVSSGLFWDRKNKFVIELREGSMENLDELDVYGGKQWIYMAAYDVNGDADGGEVLGVRDATPVSPTSISMEGYNWRVIAGTKIVEHDGVGPNFSLLLTEGRWVRIKEDLFGQEIFAKLTGATSTQMQFAEYEGTMVDTSFEEGSATSEVVQDSNTYECSVLLRGLRDTWDHDGELEPGAKSFVIDLSAVSFIPVGKNKIGSKKWLKVLPKGAALSDVIPRSAKLVGESVRPFAPGHPHYLRSGVDDHDVDIRWVHRTRIPSDDPTATQLHDLLEKHEEYLLEIYSDAGLTALLRSPNKTFFDHSLHRGRAHTYTAAQQTSDGITPGDEFWVRIRQVGTLKKAGNWSRVLHVQAESVYHPPTGGLAAEPVTYGS